MSWISLQNIKNSGGFRLAFADGIDDFIKKEIELLMPDNPNKKMATLENGQLGSGVNISGPKSEANISKVQGDTPSSLPKRNGKGNISNSLKDDITKVRSNMPNTALGKRGNMASAEVDVEGMKKKYLAHSKINKCS